jgi:mRNA-degrading endonuclease toxin of MazEF toxin-antitoxin module/DNA-directed RNA polymerase subunit RPC12/RpoP
MSNSLASVHPELIPEWSERNLPLTPDKITFGSNKRVWWKGACGHEWETSVKARSKGEKCPICSGARVIEGINDLVTLKPLLAQEWSEKNKLKPTEVSVASHKKIIWKCKHGHEWEASVKSRTINGTGCPYCSHNKVLAGFNDLASQYPDIAAEWSDRNLPLLPTMVTAFANSKAWWKCRDCGNEWYTLISTRAGGSRCPYCSGYTLLKGFNDLATTHPDIAAEWSERNYPLMPDEVNAKSRHNVWWKCKTCGNEWKSVINARVKGTVCPVCADRTVLAGYNDLATIIVAAVTAVMKKKYLPSHIILGEDFGLKKPSMVLLEQIQTVNKDELTDYIGSVNDERLWKQINAALKKTFGLWIYNTDRNGDVRCLCPKCLSDYIHDPNYVVRRLDPFAKSKDHCDKCNNSGWDYIVYDKRTSVKGKGCRNVK